MPSVPLSLALCPLIPRPVALPLLIPTLPSLDFGCFCHRLGGSYCFIGNKLQQEILDITATVFSARERGNFPEAADQDPTCSLGGEQSFNEGGACSVTSLSLRPEHLVTPTKSIASLSAGLSASAALSPSDNVVSTGLQVIECVSGRSQSAI